MKAICPLCGAVPSVETNGEAVPLALACECGHAARLKPLPDIPAHFAGDDGRLYSAASNAGLRALSVRHNKWATIRNRGYRADELLAAAWAGVPLAPRDRPIVPKPRTAPKPSRKRLRKPNVPAEEFIRVWQESPTTPAVEDRLGMSRQAVQQRAHKIRKHGVPLKKMPRMGCGGRQNDWVALAELARSLAPHQTEEKPC